MEEKTIFRAVPAVNALRIVLIIMLFLYGLIFVIGTRLLFVFVRTAIAPMSGSPFWEIKFFLERMMPGIFYFFIAYRIFKLIGLISKGEPFHSASPRHIRWIGYAVFGLALMHAAGRLILDLGAPTIDLSDSIFRIVYNSLSTLLIGFGFLVIAKVIEAGVALKQDQDLTV